MIVSLAADGPTAFNIATALVAALGLAVSLYSVRRQIKRETRAVKVVCRYSFPVGAVSQFAPDSMVTLEVLNEGHRPIEVTQVGFELSDGRQPLILPLPLEGPIDFPRTLGDGATASFYFDLDQLTQAEANVGQHIRRAFVDASGSRYYGPYVEH